MAKKNLNKIFLSASIPYPERDEKFYSTADIVAIRDSVRALTTVVVPKAQLIWGGHPAITPLIRFVTERMDVDLKEHVTLYQSNFFRRFFPKDNLHFENKVIVEEGPDKNSSLLNMRKEMLSNNFSAAIFIGGMEGVLEEFEIFRKYNPNVLTLPIASTGAAAKIIFENNGNQNERLISDFAYMALFRDLLSDFI
ncbi:MAG TPA: hypothetical protein VFD29_06510 [Gillisia sp.]|nr:hypothetical protein [Gillisia sp.]